MGISFGWPHGVTRCIFPTAAAKAPPTTPCFALHQWQSVVSCLTHVSPVVFQEGWSFAPLSTPPGLCNSRLTEMCHAFGLEQLAGLVQKMELLPKSGSLLFSSWEEGHGLHLGHLLLWSFLLLDEDILLQSTESHCFSSGQETSQCSWLAAVLNSGFLG